MQHLFKLQQTGEEDRKYGNSISYGLLHREDLKRKAALYRLPCRIENLPYFLMAIIRSYGLMICHAGFLILLSVLLLPGERVWAQTITTIAGTGILGYNGESGTATQILLYYPASVALDAEGNIYIADNANHRVRKINNSGEIATIAGTGVAGYSGDNGPATNAQLYNPKGVAVDAAGNIYIADWGNHSIRKIGTNGAITTIAGRGYPGNRGDHELAVYALLYYPVSVAVDAGGNIFIADSGNNRIRKVNIWGTITTIAGTGVPGFNGDGGAATSAEINNPAGVTVDFSGNVFIADRNNNRIRKINTSGVITTIAGTGVAGFSGDDGDAIAAQLNYPMGVAADASGSVYIADYSNHRIRKVTSAGTISTVAGPKSGGTSVAGYSGDGGLATYARLQYPTHVAIDASGNLYVTDLANDRIRKVDTEGIITTIGGKGTRGFSGDGGPATKASLYHPAGTAVDASGNIYIADFYNNCIRKIDPSGIITTIAGVGGGYGYGGDWGPATNAGMYPTAVAVDCSGNLYVAERYSNRIRKIDANGIITTFAGNGSEGFSGDGGHAYYASINEPAGVAVDAAGNVYIADHRNSRIRKINSTGVITTIAGTGTQGFSGDGGPAINAQLGYPGGVAVDATGNIYIADLYNNVRIRKIDPNGIITTIAGTGVQGFSGDGGPATEARLMLPINVAVDIPGNVYIADLHAHRVRKVGTDGIITTIAGTGTEGFSGDGGIATNAQLNEPYGVAVDAYGNVYVSEHQNHRIRKITAASGVQQHHIAAPTASGSWPGSTTYNNIAHFAINEAAGATAYKWSVPAGFEIVTGQHTAQVSVRALSGTASGNITVRTVIGCLEGEALIAAISATKATASLTVSDLNHQFSGEPKPVAVSTQPAGLVVDISYNGSREVPSAAGEYAVSAVVIDNNYAGEARAILSINTITAIENSTKYSAVKLYPNPTRSSARLELENGTKARITVMDVTGYILREATVSDAFEINLEGYGKGMYLIKIEPKDKPAVTLKLQKIF